MGFHGNKNDFDYGLRLRFIRIQTERIALIRKSVMRRR